MNALPLWRFYVTRQPPPRTRLRNRFIKSCVRRCWQIRPPKCPCDVVWLAKVGVAPFHLEGAHKMARATCWSLAMKRPFLRPLSWILSVTGRFVDDLGENEGDFMTCTRRSLHWLPWTLLGIMSSLEWLVSHSGRGCWKRTDVLLCNTTQVVKLNRQLNWMFTFFICKLLLCCPKNNWNIWSKSFRNRQQIFFLVSCFPSSCCSNYESFSQNTTKYVPI